MVQFVASLGRQAKDWTFKDLVTHSIYLGKDERDGDNSDNGHHVIDVRDLGEELD